MKRLLIALALTTVMAGCAHTLGQIETTATQAVKVPLAVYQDVKENVNAVIEYVRQQEAKPTE